MDINVFLQIQFCSSDSALVTNRLIDNSLLLFIGGLFGSIFGVMEIVGVAMGFFEENIEKVKKRISKGSAVKKALKNQKNIMSAIYSKSKSAKVAPTKDLILTASNEHNSYF